MILYKKLQNELININLLENEKIQKIKEILTNKKAIIAFSGGVDSSLITYLAKQFASDAYAITIKSEFISDDEIKEAKEIAGKIGIDWNLVNLSVMNDPEIKNNPPDRCYLCKRTIIKTLLQIKTMENFDLIIDGTNADDLLKDRPGLEALKEFKIISPLAEVGLTKDEIRKIANNLQLSSWNKPSMPCIATRFPSFYDLNLDEIKMVMDAENFIRFEYDIKILRVRSEFKKARIEVDKNEMEKLLKLDVIRKINDRLKELGFVQVTLDLNGYKSS